MGIDLARSASPLEIGWTLLSAVALGFHLWNLVDLHKTFEAILATSARETSALRWQEWLIVAGEDLRHETVRCVKQTGFLLVGLIALVTPPPAVPEVTAFGTLAAIVFLAIQMMLMVDAIWDRWDGAKLDRIHEAQAEQGE